MTKQEIVQRNTKNFIEEWVEQLNAFDTDNLDECFDELERIANEMDHQREMIEDLADD